MRTYGQKFLKNAAKRVTRQATETMDAILWDVQMADRVCRVKVQGSNEYIIARFPQNWHSVPSWCKPGQAVRIVHRGGVRGYIEIDGYGRAIPTPVAGSTSPPQPTPPDAVINGLQIRALPQVPGMYIWVKTGAVRFDGVAYDVPAVSVDNGAKLIRADMGLIFGDVAGFFAITAPGAGFKYYAISVGADLIVYITAGTPFTTTETKPAIPAGNILLGYLLVKAGQTSITANDIAAIYTPPTAAILSVSAADNGLDQTITATVKDQYGANIAASGGWTIAAEIESGDGSLDAASKNTGAGASASFTYTEGTAGTLVLLYFSITQGDVSLNSYTTIQL